MFSNRRDFLKKVGGIALAGSIIPDVWAANLAGKPRISKIGVQLYTAMGAMEQDTEGTLRAIAQIGYKELETAGSRKGGYYGKSAKEFAAFAKDLGMSWKSHHITAAPRTPSGSTNTAGRPAMKTLRDNYQEVVDDMAAAGVPFLVCSSAPIKTLDEVKQSMEIFQKTGEACQKAGITFAFHNHSAEFELVEGIKPYDLFTKELSSDILKFELDVAWAMRAGVDPLALFKLHPGRFPLLHIKDVEKETFKPVEIGKGFVDYRPVLAAIRTAGTKHIFVEQDAAPKPLENLMTSFTALQKLI